jgi:hypothetical protein
MSVPPKGNVLPKLGKELPMTPRNGSIGYAPAIAEALTTELRGSNRAIKTVMRWTGASERTVKGWLSGTSGPSGEHLIALLQNSDTLLERVLRLAGRGSLIEGRRLESLKNTMVQAVATIEALLDEG